MAIHEKQPHFVLIPFMAQGHMIPMVDIARLLASEVFKTVIDRAIDSGLSIHVFHLKFPCVEVGLPEGHENFDMLPSIDEALKIAPRFQTLPSCLIADMCFPWTTSVALKLHIPRLLFHGTSCFSLLCLHMLGISKDFEAITSDTEYFVVPDLPDRIEITKAQLRGTANQIPSDWAKIREQMQESEVEAFGTVANTFEELEPEYIKEYMKVKGKKVWCIGPVSLCNKDDLDKSERGNKASIDEHQCLKWLDSQETSSVIYVCLGSLSRLATSQLIELGLGLETSNRPFIWVIRNASDEFKTWLLEEKFEERTNRRGLLIHGWAPQVLILSHPSQFCNEKFIVNVIKTGIRVGVEVPVIFGEEENVGVQVKNDDIKMAIDKRERARKLGEMAKSAPEEGGSSYLNMTQLIQDVIMQQAASHGGQSANDAK
ncbi:hypothetical protein Pfo_028709 [Paulownia fortunei]|nr:hypothetical protein Pfo_028709 [Paulownia fortunei]